MVSFIIGAALVICTLVPGHLFFEIERAKERTRRTLANAQSIEAFVSDLWKGGFLDRKAKELGATGMMWDVVLANGGTWSTIVDMEINSTKSAYLLPQCVTGCISFFLLMAEGVVTPTAFVISACLLFLLYFVPQGAPSARRSDSDLADLCWIIHNYNKANPEDCEKFTAKFTQFENLRRAIVQFGQVNAQADRRSETDREGPEIAPPVLTEEPSILDGERAAAAIREHFENLQHRLSSERERLLAIMKPISERIGGPVIVCDQQGEVSAHPDLIMELRKPENADLADRFAELVRMMSSDAQRKSDQT